MAILTTTNPAAVLPTIERIQSFCLPDHEDPEDSYIPTAWAVATACVLLVRSLDVIDWTNRQVDAVPLGGGGILIEWQDNDREHRYQSWIRGESIQSLAAVRVTVDSETKTHRYTDDHAESIDAALEALRQTMED